MVIVCCLLVFACVGFTCGFDVCLLWVCWLIARLFCGVVCTYVVVLWLCGLFCLRIVLFYGGFVGVCLGLVCGIIVLCLIWLVVSVDMFG